MQFINHKRAIYKSEMQFINRKCDLQTAFDVTCDL